MQLFFAREPRFAVSTLRYRIEFCRRRSVTAGMQKARVDFSARGKSVHQLLRRLSEMHKARDRHGQSPLARAKIQHSKTLQHPATRDRMFVFADTVIYGHQQNRWQNT